jgi:hypothetical protein
MPMVGKRCCLGCFAYVARDARFHVLQEQIHILMLPFSRFSYKWVDIVLFVDGIHTLADVIIVNLT